MTVKNVVAAAARLVLSDAVADKIAAGSTLTTDEQNDFNRLIRGFNLVMKEVAAEYLPLVVTQTFSGGNVSYSTLTHAPYKIRGAYDEKGDPVVYETFPTFIKLPEKSVSVAYEYIPEDCAANDTFVYEGSFLENAFCYGVASEFCMASGRYDEAQNWDVKFRRAARPPLRKKPKRIKCRTWGL